MTCRELVELVTDYLEGALAPEDRERFEAHLEACDGCTGYLDQIRLTVVATGRLTESSLDPPVREALVEVFRDWKRSAV
jgi:anti-sigma factor RsiW